MDTEALAIGARPELARTSTAAPVLKPSGTNPGGTAPVGKLIRVAKIWGGGAEEELPPPPPLQAASSRHAAAARPPSLLWDSMSSLPGRSRSLTTPPQKRAHTATLVLMTYYSGGMSRWRFFCTHFTDIPTLKRYMRIAEKFQSPSATPSRR